MEQDTLSRLILAINGSVAVTALASVATLVVVSLALGSRLIQMKNRRRPADIDDKLLKDVHEVLKEIKDNKFVPEALRDRARSADQAMLSRR
jgi:hypothetical protein